MANRHALPPLALLRRCPHLVIRFRGSGCDGGLPACRPACPRGRMELLATSGDFRKDCSMASFSTDDVNRALAPLAGDPVFQRLQVSNFRPEFGEDAHGEPAFWIYVLIRPEL